MKSVAEGVHDGADGAGNALEWDNVTGWHRDVFGERPVAVHTDDRGVPAYVPIARSALATVAAHDVSLRGHRLADVQFYRDFIANLHDLAGEFVSDDDGRFYPALRPLVPIGDVQVRATNPGMLYSDEYLGRSTRRFGDIGNLQAGTGLEFLNCAHYSSQDPGSAGDRAGARTAHAIPISDYAADVSAVHLECGAGNITRSL
jgi:hypothetical protein